MRNFTILFVVLAFFSCKSDDESTVPDFQNLEQGAVLRTVSVNSAEININDIESAYSIEIEEQDTEDGALLDEVEVYVSFKDNTTDNGDSSKSEILFFNIPAEEWEIGPGNLPRYTLSNNLESLLSLFELNLTQVSCKDQFIIRLNLKLTNGKSFTSGSAGPSVIAFGTFFSSPYRYAINIVEPISETSFLGTYTLTSIVEPDGSSFGDVVEAELFRGTSNTERIVFLKHRLSHPLHEEPRAYRFNFVCDEVVFGENQLTGLNGACNFSNQAMLLGPGFQNGFFDRNDDKIFELEFVEGYLGFDGGCGFGTLPSRYRFVKL